MIIACIRTSLHVCTLFFLFINNNKRTALVHVLPGSHVDGIFMVGIGGIAS